MLLIDPLDAIVKAVFLWRDEREREQWIRLIMSIAFSDIIAFFVVVGTSLVATREWTVSIGSGMIIVATITLALLLKSPLASKLTLVLTPEETEAYQQQLNKGLTTIEPKK